MKQAKEIIAQLRQTFNELVKNAEVPQPPADSAPVAAPIVAKLADGTEITISEMIVGGMVTQNGQPMAPGNYTLEDSTVIIVGDNGVIIEIVTAAPAAPATEPPATEPPADNVPADMVNQLTSRFQKFENQANEKFKVYENKFADYEARLIKATKVIEGLLNLTQTLAETPTGNPDPAIRGSQIFNANRDKTDFSFDILFS